MRIPGAQGADARAADAAKGGVALLHPARCELWPAVKRFNSSAGWVWWISPAVDAGGRAAASGRLAPRAQTKAGPDGARSRCRRC